MISAALLALVSLSSPVSGTVAYAGDSVAAGKGHPAVAARGAVKSSAPTVCHPDPSKGRACRHTVVQAEAAAQAKAPAFAAAEAAAPTIRD